MSNHDEKKVQHEEVEATPEEATPEVEVMPESAPVQSAVEKAVEESFKQQFMRVTADFSNYKRRVDKERIQWVTTGQTTIIQAFLPVVDDVERALTATRTAQEGHEDDSMAQILEGFELIEKNLHKVLDKMGVAEIACDGAFNPEHHEALMQAASDSHESGQVVQVLSKGYTYKGAVLRHAKVSVAS